MKDRKFKRFSRKEERELLYKFKKENNKYAIEKLMKDNKWLVLWLASSIKERKRAENELDDLIQEGDIALFKAIQGFELEKYKNRISTYAYSKIKQAVIRKIKEREIHIPEYIQGYYSNICRTENFLKERLGRKATLEEISDETGFSIKNIESIYENMGICCTSMDAPIEHKKSESSGSKKKLEVIGDFSYFSVDQLLILKQELEKIMEIVLDTINQFSEKKKSIFYEYFICDKSFTEIAEKFSCWSSGIGQSVEKMLKTLYIRLKKNGHEVQRDRIKPWLSDKIYLCYWLKETTGTRFNILEYKWELIKQ